MKIKKLQWTVSFTCMYYVKNWEVMDNADDETKLLDADGKWITCHGSGNPSSDDAIFDDFKFYIDNLKIQKASNLQEKEVNAHILVTFDGGKTWITQSGPYTISW